MRKKKKEKDFKEIEKIECYQCQTLNDSDANFCKKCGADIYLKKEKSNLLFYMSTIFKVLSITIAIDVIWLTKPLLGTSTGDSIIIEYSLILAVTLFLATCFRVFSEGNTIFDLLNKEVRIDRKTQSEFGISFLLLLCAIIMCIYSNTRIIFLKPGNNYVERKVNKHIQRWYKVQYARTGVRKCKKKTKIWKNYSITTPFCYDYTYIIKFRDGDTCFIHYTSHFDHKVNKEAFSYCAKK